MKEPGWAPLEANLPLPRHRGRARSRTQPQAHPHPLLERPLERRRRGGLYPLHQKQLSRSLKEAKEVLVLPPSRLLP